MKIDVKILPIYIITSIYIIISSFICFSNHNEFFTYILNPIAWFVIFLLLLFISKDFNSRFKSKVDKSQTIFIFLLLYLIIYFLSGLFFGYQRSPYSHTLIGYIKNFIAFFLVVIFKEFSRSIFVNNCGKSKLTYMFITLLFIIVELNFKSLVLSFNSGADLFKYICSDFFPIVAKNILLTYLVLMAGCSASLAYLLPIAFANIVLPIFPALDWFMSSFAQLILILFVFIAINRIHEKKMFNMSKRILRRNSPYKKIAPIILLIIFVFFIAGFFKYMPVAIMSNSMKKLISRGDVVIVSKLESDEIKELQVGDIIEYSLDNSIVVHRIIKIENVNENILFTTMGDNNSAPDNRKVVESQIIGVVKAKIPKIGYPSVFLNEFFNKTKPDVET